ncbi:MAG: hypothetical protein K6E39_03975 [Lachnospiraceae bacterium]|nr:hypothetical protein [Lachnospiraceae bacterium]
MADNTYNEEQELNERLAKLKVKQEKKKKAEREAMAAKAESNNNASSDSNGQEISDKANANSDSAGKTVETKQSAVTSEKETLNDGVIKYNSGDYAGAFKVFKEYANNNNADAMYYLAMMFKNGQGTSQDDKQSVFWFKKAADSGNIEAKYAYGKKCLSEYDIYTAHKYIKDAADNKFTQAMMDYIVMAADKNLIPNPFECGIARKYCNNLKKVLTDQYQLSQLEEYKKQLEDVDKNINAEARRIRVIRGISIAGSVFLIIGFLYWFGGIHPIEWDSNVILRIFPDAGKWLIIPISFLWDKTSVFMDNNGRFGVELIAIAFIIFKGTNAYYLTRKNYYNCGSGKIEIRDLKISELTVSRGFYLGAVAFASSMTVIHFLVSIRSGMTVWYHFIGIMLTFTVCWIIGEVLGSILGKFIFR